MRIREPFDLPTEREADLAQAKRLAWSTIAFMLFATAVIGATMGGSQAMRTAWFDDILSLIPSVAFLVSCRVARRAPDPRFPFGYHRVVSIAFLCASAALFAVGALLLYESVATLARRERPSIGTVVVFGQQVWLGWLMIAALVVTSVPIFFLGRRKVPVAHALHDKTLFADADMNRADWMSGAAAIGGVFGIALGFWWADAVAAGFISFSILHDGWRNLKQVIFDLMDEVPTPVGSDRPEPLIRRLRDAALALDWVQQAEVRLREEGHLFTGEVWVVPRHRAADTELPARVARAAGELQALDWRLYDLTLMPVDTLNPESESR